MNKKTYVKLGCLLFITGWTLGVHMCEKMDEKNLPSMLKEQWWDGHRKGWERAKRWHNVSHEVPEYTEVFGEEPGK